MTLMGEGSGRDEYCAASLSERPAAALHEIVVWASRNQTVASTGRPNTWRELGARIVDEHKNALRKLAES